MLLAFQHEQSKNFHGRHGKFVFGRDNRDTFHVFHDGVFYSCAWRDVCVKRVKRHYPSRVFQSDPRQARFPDGAVPPPFRKKGLGRGANCVALLHNYDSHRGGLCLFSNLTTKSLLQITGKHAILHIK